RAQGASVASASGSRRPPPPTGPRVHGSSGAAGGAEIAWILPALRETNMSKAEDILSRLRRKASAFSLASDLLADGAPPAHVECRLVNEGLSTQEAHEIVSTLQAGPQRLENALRGRQDLRSLAAVFLMGPCIISEPGASLLRLIARYADGQPWDDPEL